MQSVRSVGLDPGDELVPTRRTLLERLRDLDDQASWQEFFNTYWKLLYCAALKAGLSDTDAEEVVQETVIVVARHMPEFRYDPGVCSFKGWLMCITRSRIIDLVRKRRSRPSAFEPLRSDTTASTVGWQLPDTAAERAFADMWDEEWTKNLVDAAMERVKRVVKPQHYQIFYLHSVKQIPARDIAELLRVSTAKVYVVRHRVGRLVRQVVKKLEQEAPAVGRK